MAIYALGDREPTLGEGVYAHPDATGDNTTTPIDLGWQRALRFDHASTLTATFYATADPQRRVAEKTAPDRRKV